ncbi:prepilin peptidase [Tistlia consotensis]|nr:prepilin peptidase [Tistlia consotensis]
MLHPETLLVAAATAGASAAACAWSRDLAPRRAGLATPRPRRPALRLAGLALIGGLAGAAAALQLPPGQALSLGFFAAVALGIARADLAQRLVPLQLSQTLLFGGLVASTLSASPVAAPVGGLGDLLSLLGFGPHAPPPGPAASIVSAAAAYLLLVPTRALLAMLACRPGDEEREAVGWGDVDLLVAVAAWGGFTVLLATLVFGGALNAAAQVVRRRGRKIFPAAPLYSFAAFLTLLPSGRSLVDLLAMR